MNKEIGCTQCPYAGHIELKECPVAYTEVSQYCGLYNHEPDRAERRCGKRFSGNITGIWHNVNHGLSEIHKFAVEYTDDELGKSLSIGNLETGDMFQIPFDELYKIIRR